ncbi:hypothetical protein F4805DRAFT_168172 [Annulohypoxylon moriforme]|nr:hypothetical protein F4805DRAFT_168172 [Annulohypoxylon moriforme]
MKRRADEPVEGDADVPKASRIDRIQTRAQTRTRDAIDAANDEHVHDINTAVTPNIEAHSDDDDESDYDDGDGSDGDDDDDDGDDDVATPLTNPNDKASPTARSTKVRKKFPSDFKTHVCNYCNHAFNRPIRLAEHVRKHTGERPHKCDKCDKSFSHRKDFNDHKKSHEDKRDHVCTFPGCNAAFLNRQRLTRHMQTHEKKLPLTCRRCNRVFRKPETLERHIRSDHHNVAGYPCGHIDDGTGLLCQASFDNAASLRRHKERQHGPIKYWCEECHQNGDKVGFPTVAQLEEHANKNHHKHKCSFCDFQSNLKSKLDRHIEDHHTQPKKTIEQRKIFPCTWPGCTKVFTKKSNMDAHAKAAHEGARFVCGECDVSGANDLAAWPQSFGCGTPFTTKGNLEKHIRHVHMKLPRPEQAQGQAKTKESSSDLLGQLAGVDATFRQTLNCPFLASGCKVKFTHIGEVREHVEASHPFVRSPAENAEQLSFHYDTNPERPLALEDSETLTFIPDPIPPELLKTYIKAYLPPSPKYTLEKLPPKKKRPSVSGGQAPVREMPRDHSRTGNPNRRLLPCDIADYTWIRDDSPIEDPLIAPQAYPIAGLEPQNQGQSNFQVENAVTSQ